MKKQVVVLVLAAVLVFGCAVGGTLAWLMDKTETVTNVFTAGNVKINLTETEGAATNYKFKMVPGENITKNPTITVTEGSENSYVFVKIDKANSVDTYLTYAIAEGWTELGTDSGVYYREYTDTAADGATYEVLANNRVTVKQNVTAEQLGALTDANYPELSFTGFAIQKSDQIADAAAAWGIINTPPAQQD